MRPDNWLAYPPNRRRAGVTAASAGTALVAVSVGLIMGLYVRTPSVPAPSRPQVVAAAADHSALVPDHHTSAHTGAATTDPWAAAGGISPRLTAAPGPDIAALAPTASSPKNNGNSDSSKDDSGNDDSGKDNSGKDDRSGSDSSSHSAAAGDSAQGGSNEEGAASSAPASAAPQFAPQAAPQLAPQAAAVVPSQPQAQVPTTVSPQVVPQTVPQTIPQGTPLGTGQTTALVPVQCPASVTGALCYQTTPLTGSAPPAPQNPSPAPAVSIPAAPSSAPASASPAIPPSLALPSTSTTNCQVSGNSGDVSGAFADDFGAGGLSGLGKFITDRLRQCMGQQSGGGGTTGVPTDSEPSGAIEPAPSSGASTSSPGAQGTPVPATPAPPTAAPCPSNPSSGSGSSTDSDSGSSSDSGSGSTSDSGSGHSPKKDQGNSDDTKTSAFIGPTLTRSLSDCAGSLGSSAVDGTSAAASGALAKIPTGPTKKLKIWLTGYSYQDNTPPGSAIVSAPLLHQKAGGTGTYTDPITVAAPGHNDGSGMGFAPGTRFYLPSVQRYVIVEDSGASPAPSGTDGHLDMWVDGEGGSKSASDDCMNRITSTTAEAIQNPPPGEPVMTGPITKDGQCNLPGGGSSASAAASPGTGGGAP
jgi:hypothetical protein